MTSGINLKRILIQNKSPIWPSKFRHITVTPSERLERKVFLGFDFFFLSLITDRRARLANFKANIEEREVKVREMVELQKNLESSAFVIL